MLETECLWFSFSTLLQKELDKVLHHWNTHYIRRSRHDTLAGRPDELYYLPENVNAENHGHVVENEKYQDMLNYCHDYQENSIYQEYFTNIFTQSGFRQPDTWNEALTLVNSLIKKNIPSIEILYINFVILVSSNYIKYSYVCMAFGS